MNIDFFSTVYKNPNPFVEADFSVVPDISVASIESSYVDFLNENEIVDVRISTKKGSVLKTLTWLRRLQHIKSLSFDGGDLEGFLDVVKDLHLDDLSIDSEILDPIILTKLGGTKSVAFTRVNTIERLDFSSSKNLESIYLGGYLGDGITLPSSIKSIRLFRSKLRNLNLIVNLDCTESIVLQENYDLEDIVAIKKCENLRKLVVENSKKIKNLNEFSLKNLEIISLLGCGEVESLKFLENSPNLKFVSFPRTTIVDGDLSILEFVSELNFENRNHYNRKLSGGKLKL